MKSIPTVLAFNQFYSPAFKAGGAVQSVANLVAHLGSEIDFRLVTTDRDSGDVQPFARIQPGEWTRVGSGRVLYIDRASLTIRTVPRELRETPHDALYLNSFYSPRFTTLPLLAQYLRLAPQKPVLRKARQRVS